MRVRVGARTDVGVVRDQNEDGYFAEFPLFAVADGMGGHQGGEVASRVALETIAAMAREQGPGLDLDAAIRAANDAILNQASADRDLEGMGTTLTIVREEDGRITIAHVGDSRAYLLRDGELRQLTEDHTLVHRMVTEGKLTEAEAKIHPHRSILTRALGVEPGIEVDVDARDVSIGDRIMLCSDGLTGMVGEEQIEEILRSTRDPQEAADLLVDEANRAGGQDNITVLILDLEKGEAPTASAEPRPTERVTVAAPPAQPTEPVDLGGGGAGRARWGAWAIRIGIAVALVVAAVLAARVYLGAQWFVGIDGDRVAIFNGIPTTFLGFDLFSLAETTDIPADDARNAGVQWRGLGEGITASSEEDAHEIVRQIEEDLGRSP